MDLIEAIKLRKSIRGYKPDPVPKEILKEILETASRAPSRMNTQPWECTIIGGETIEKIKQANIKKLHSGEAPPIGEVFSGVYRERQVTTGIQLFKLMGIAREDKEKRAEWMMRGFRFFDAPAAIIIAADNSLSEEVLFDIGTLTQTIALTALNYGLGTCIESIGIAYPDVIREFTGIPESKKIIICLAIGYPNWDFSANKMQSEREPVENFTDWCGI